MRAKCVYWLAGFGMLVLPGLSGADSEWNPNERCLKILVDAVPGILRSQDKATGRFDTAPWICTDQNVLYPLAAAWKVEDPKNPYHGSAEVLEAIMKGGDALVAAQDDKGMWTFRKKDNSTWGQIYMAWTYSRWIRAFRIIKDAMPPERRVVWERGLQLGFDGISQTCLKEIHNIPTHQAMALYCAGLCFQRDEWTKQASEFLGRVVKAQSPDGWWSQHSGPLIKYNYVFVESLGAYYTMSHEASVLDALRRAAVFHTTFTYPDGTDVETIDERNPFETTVERGCAGFSHTPEGRAYLLRQSQFPGRSMTPDTAAEFLLEGETGPASSGLSEREEFMTVTGDGHALVLRRKPWFICLSAFTGEISESRWIQDRQNFVSIFRDGAGLLIGGGNTKLQPYWSNFTVGDPALLRHEPGDEKPHFKPSGDLLHVPQKAALRTDAKAPGLDLTYGDEPCRITVSQDSADQLTISCEASCRSGKLVEGHIALLPRLGTNLVCASGRRIKLGQEAFEWSASEMGNRFDYVGFRLSVPPGARLMWPEKRHNPYKKDGSSSLEDARLVLCLPFSPAVTKHEIVLKAIETVTP